MIKQDLEARLDEVYYNLIKILDTEYKVYVDDVYLSLMSETFFVFHFVINGYVREAEVFVDEITSNPNKIYRTIIERYLRDKDEKYQQPSNPFKVEPNQCKAFLDLFPTAKLVYEHNGKYELKAGDKILYKGYIAEVLYIDEDGDIELKYSNTSNSFPPKVFDGCDVVYIAKRSKKKNIEEFKREIAGSWLPDDNMKIRLETAAHLFRRSGKTMTTMENVLFPEQKEVILLSGTRGSPKANLPSVEEAVKELFDKDGLQGASSRFKELAKKAGLIK